MRFKVPSADGVNAGGGGPSWRDEKFAKSYPTLCEWLGATIDDACAPRVTGTMLVFAEAGSIKACLTDRQGGVRAFLTATTFVELLETADSGLEGGGLDWRLPKDGGAQRRR